MNDSRRFDPSELDAGEPGGTGNADAAELLATARDLEAFARAETVGLSVDFEDRVMVAIAAEPPPRAVAAGGVLGLFILVRDAWRLTWSGDRPLAVRAQALAFVLLAAVAFGSLGSLAAVGVGALLEPDAPAPSVLPAPSPSPSPSALPSPSPSDSPSPSPTPSVSATTGTADPTETAEPTDTADPTETAESTDDSSGPGPGSGSSSSSGSGSGLTDDSSGPGSGDDRTTRPTDDSSGLDGSDDPSG